MTTTLLSFDVICLLFVVIDVLALSCHLLLLLFLLLFVCCLLLLMLSFVVVVFFVVVICLLFVIIGVLAACRKLRSL